MRFYKLDQDNNPIQIDANEWKRDADSLNTELITQSLGPGKAVRLIFNPIRPDNVDAPLFSVYTAAGALDRNVIDDYTTASSNAFLVSYNSVQPMPSFPDCYRSLDFDTDFKWRREGGEYVLNSNGLEAVIDGRFMGAQYKIGDDEYSFVIGSATRGIDFRKKTIARAVSLFLANYLETL